MKHLKELAASEAMLRVFAAAEEARQAHDAAGMAYPEPLLRFLGLPTPKTKRIAGPGGFIGKCPRCTRVPEIHIAEGEVIGECAQCWLGEGAHSPFVELSHEVKP